MGWGGNTSSPGQPGTCPSLPRVPISQAEPSATTMSSTPWVQRTGGLGSSPTMEDQLQYFGDRALRMPRLPGAIPGQLSDGVESPGYPSGPVTDFRTSSTSRPSRSAGSRCLGDQYDEFNTFRGENGDSLDRSPAASRLVNFGLPVPSPDPAWSGNHGVPSSLVPPYP